MKKLIFSAAVILSLLAVSCFNDYSIPHGLSVSTKAKYNFTITELDKDLSEYFSITDIITNASGSGFEVYDYNPGNNQVKQKFLLRIPVQEIPLDFGSFMAATDLGTSLGSMGFEQDIQIPSVNINSVKEFDIDAINTAVNGMVTFTGPVTGSYTQQQVYFAATFDHVEYQTGQIVVSTGATGQVRLYSGETEDAAKANMIASGNISDGKAVLNLNGKSLYAAYTYIAFQNADSSNFVALIEPSSKLKTAYGVNYPTVALPEIETTFDVGTGNDALESCQFGTGCSLHCEIQTPDWSGLTITKNIELSGGLNLTINSDDTNLSGVTFSNEDINAKANLSIAFTNATIIFVKKPKISMGTTIPSIAQITAKLPDGTNTSINVNKDLPDEAKSMVNSVTWKAGCGIKVKYTNTFPTGNDFTLKNVSSTFLGLTGTSPQTLQAGHSNETVEFLTTTQNVSTIGSTTKIDFKADLDLPGSVSGKIIAVDVEPGKTYKVKLEVTPVLDWEEIEIDTGDLSSSGNTFMDFNLNSMFSSLDTALGCNISSKINLSELPIHLYCDIPDLSAFNNPNFSGKIKFFLADSGGSQIGSNATYILGTSSSDGIMPFYTEPTLTKDTNNVVISTVSGGLQADLAPVLNASASHANSKLGLNYSMGLSTGSTGNLTINHDALSASSSTTIKITAIIVLPLEFNLTGDVSIDVLNLMDTGDRTDPSWDVLQRTGPTDVDAIEKILDVIENVSIAYEPTKKPFISSNDINIIMDMDGSGTNFQTKVLSLNGGKYSENPSKLLHTYPLQPEVILELKAGMLAIPRQMAIKTRIDLGIETNGHEIPIFGGN